MNESTRTILPDENAIEKNHLKQYIRWLELLLEHEHKFAAIGELVSGIVHNIGTPLTGIIGYADMMKSEHPEIEDVGKILKQANRIDAIIKNFLAKSRYEQDREIVPVNINDLLKIQLEFLQAYHKFKHGVIKTYNFSESMPLIPAVYSDISESFSNILLCITETTANSEKKELALATDYDDTSVWFQIEGTGTEFPGENLESVFQPGNDYSFDIKDYDQTKISLYLGVSIAYRILKKYNATVETEIKSNIGTKIKISIPRHKKEISWRDKLQRNSTATEKE